MVLYNLFDCRVFFNTVEGLERFSDTHEERARELSCIFSANDKVLEIEALDLLYRKLWFELLIVDEKLDAILWFDDDCSGEELVRIYLKGEIVDEVSSESDLDEEFDKLKEKYFHIFNKEA